LHPWETAGAFLKETNMSNPKVDLLLQASIEHVKSLLGFNVCQTEHKVIVEVYIKDEKVLSIDLSSISAFNNIALNAGELNFKSEEYK
jgi:hypothetical protein